MADVSTLSNVLPALITGVVGVAGIGGTVFAARMTSKSQHEDLLTSISAGREDARKADKRRTYANALGAINAAYRARFEWLEDVLSDDADIKGQALSHLNESLYQMYRACDEAHLIAPPKVQDGLNSFIDILGGSNTSTPEGWRKKMHDSYNDAFGKLFFAMRADLDSD